MKSATLRGDISLKRNPANKIKRRNLTLAPHPSVGARFLANNVHLIYIKTIVIIRTIRFKF